jgi:hypothetical protein
VAIEFSANVWRWDGPAPYYFVTVPAEYSQDLKSAAKLITYGWGMVPVELQVGKTRWFTSLFPKDGGYILPLKASVRTSEHIEEGDMVKIRLEVAQKKKP